MTTDQITSLHVCFSAEVMLDCGSICEILCLWNHHCGIMTINSRCVAVSSGQTVQCVCVRRRILLKK